MADAYRKLVPDPSVPPGKSPRPGYDFAPPGVGIDMGVHAGQVPSAFSARDDSRAATNVPRDPKSIMELYDQFLQNGQAFSDGAGEPRNMAPSAYTVGPPGAEFVLLGGPGLLLPNIPTIGRNVGFGNLPPIDPMPRPILEASLPPDASSTLFVEGLPSDATHREVAHIFRPFLGYREVRLVIKDSKHPGGDPLILCFVDFTNANCAATALSVSCKAIRWMNKIMSQWVFEYNLHGILDPGLEVAWALVVGDKGGQDFSKTPVFAVCCIFSLILSRGSICNMKITAVRFPV